MQQPELAARNPQIAAIVLRNTEYVFANCDSKTGDPISVQPYQASRIASRHKHASRGALKKASHVVVGKLEVRLGRQVMVKPI